MSETVEAGASALNLFKVAIKLARGTDTCHVVARDVEDAIKQVRHEYADLNVLYIESIARVGGSLFISKQAKETF